MSDTTDTADEHAFLEEVARFFNRKADGLTMDTQQGDFADWDSIGHLNLVLELAKAHGKPMDPDQIGELLSVRALHGYFTGGTGQARG